MTLYALTLHIDPRREALLLSMSIFQMSKMRHKEPE